MEDKKLLKIAENCCSDMVNCERCPLDADALTADECMAKVIRFLLEIVSRQKAEIKKKDTEIAILIRKNEALKDEVSELRADKEALINGQITLQEKLPGVIKNEAYKEFADKLIAKAEIVAGGDYGFTYEIGEDEIDNLLAEMEERE